MASASDPTLVAEPVTPPLTVPATPVAGTTAPSDKTVSAPTSAPVSEPPPVIPAERETVLLHIYLRIRQVPEWAWRAREVYDPVVGHKRHTMKEWDALFSGF